MHAIRDFVLGSGGVFVGVPIGSGKSLCFAALPFVFDIVRARAGSVVSSAIHNGGSSKYRARGLDL